LRSPAKDLLPTKRKGERGKSRIKGRKEKKKRFYAIWGEKGPNDNGGRKKKEKKSDLCVPKKKDIYHSGGRGVGAEKKKRRRTRIYRVKKKKEKGGIYKGKIGMNGGEELFGLARREENYIA